MKPAVTWLGHASILLEGKITVVIDPWKIGRHIEADVVLITHSHFDHLSPPDITRVLKPEGKVFGPPDAMDKVPVENRLALHPGDRQTVQGITIEAVPAYNIGKEFHPKTNGWLGYVVRFAERSFYIAGDTDLIPEMEKIRADVLFLPIGGTYTMNPAEAARAAGLIKPKLTIPVHFGDIVGEMANGKQFQAAMGKLPSHILTPGKSFTL